MVTISFPFRIENGGIVVENESFNNNIEIQNLLQMYMKDYNESFYNLQETGMFKTFLFKNITPALKTEMANILKQIASTQQQRVEVQEVIVHTKKELEEGGVSNYNFSQLENYTDTTLFINLIIYIPNKDLTLGILMSEMGDIFNEYIINT